MPLMNIRLCLAEPERIGLFALSLFAYAILGGQILIARKRDRRCLGCGKYTIAGVEVCLLCACGIRQED